MGPSPQFETHAGEALPEKVILVKKLSADQKVRRRSYPQVYEQNCVNFLLVSPHQPQFVKASE